MIPKPVTPRDEAYKAWIREQACLACGRTPSEPHHQPARGHGSTGRKTSDYRCVPLCGGIEGHHRGRGTPQVPGSLHTVGNHFWDRLRIDPEMEILRLNSCYFFGG